MSFVVPTRVVNRLCVRNLTTNSVFFIVPFRGTGTIRRSKSVNTLPVARTDIDVLILYTSRAKTLFDFIFISIGIGLWALEPEGLLALRSLQEETLHWMFYKYLWNTSDTTASMRVLIKSHKDGNSLFRPKLMVK